MNCYQHTDRESVGTCTSCGRAICNDCAVEMQGKLVCRVCLEEGKATLQDDGQKDPNTAFLIELVGGLFGFLGLGFFYVGRTNDGLIRLAIFLIYNLIAYVIIALGGGLTMGILACICAPFQLAIQLGVAFWSAKSLKNEMLSSLGTGFIQKQSNQHPHNIAKTKTATKIDAPKKTKMPAKPTTPKKPAKTGKPKEDDGSTKSKS